LLPAAVNSRPALAVCWRRNGSTVETTPHEEEEEEIGRSALREQLIIDE
jgi:hypothetical protein